MEDEAGNGELDGGPRTTGTHDGRERLGWAGADAGHNGDPMKHRRAVVDGRRADSFKVAPDDSRTVNVLSPVRGVKARPGRPKTDPFVRVGAIG